MATKNMQLQNKVAVNNIFHIKSFYIDNANCVTPHEIYKPVCTEHQC